MTEQRRDTCSRRTGRPQGTCAHDQEEVYADAQTKQKLVGGCALCTCKRADEHVDMVREDNTRRSKPVKLLNRTLELRHAHAFVWDRGGEFSEPNDPPKGMTRTSWMQS
eukprot:CAMPEP_0119332764 /NCGR_PEP_ID=MMETSP1333-20130426/83575_1 /TAXON_ID=418940 /ORGANISM="Scyphosphaera apsteinii, Strain RCC1455" /LENGTH=108 /DNA_ID=CAMNT_0007342663 /DNA_START=278 /DNA_END=604 /DNA_ORIENTATION=-